MDFPFPPPTDAPPAVPPDVIAGYVFIVVIGGLYASMAVGLNMTLRRAPSRQIFERWVLATSTLLPATLAVSYGFAIFDRHRTNSFLAYIWCGWLICGALMFLVRFRLDKIMERLQFGF